MELATKGIPLPKNKLCIILPDEDGHDVYCCVECPAKYKEKDKLEIHLCSDHNKEYRFLCGVCGTGLKRKEHLDRHLLGHQEVRPHLCIDCGKGFKRKEHLNIHKAIHSGDKSHICPFCHRSFYRKDHLQKHMQTHNKGGELELNLSGVKLDISGIKIEPQDFMQMEQDQEMSEMMTHSNENITIDPERPFACHICHKTYKRKDHLKLHSYTHIEKDKICSECGKAFHKEEQLLAHMNVHLDRAIIKQDDSDDFNPLVINTDNLLIVRMDKQDSRPHACEMCGKRFKRKQHLKVHANVHRNVSAATIWCSLCSEGFHNNDQFEQHECLSQTQIADHGTDAFIYPDTNTDTDKPYNFNKYEVEEPYQENGYSDTQENGYSNTQENGYSDTQENGYSDTQENGYSNTQENGYSDTQENGYSDTQENGYSNTQENGYSDTQENGYNETQDEYVNEEEGGESENYLHNYEQMTVENLSISPLVSLQEQHIPTPQRVFVCKFCSKPFKRKDHYKIHLHIHTGVKSFFCVDCGKGFYRKDHLQKHALVHAKARLVKPKKELPALYPIGMLKQTPTPTPASTAHVKPEITITAPMNSKLRLPLQIKVPYQMVTATDSVTVTPQ